jgi:hypothetical protein
MALIQQRHIKSDELVSFLKNSVEPLNDQTYGNRYRVARLTDGTYLRPLFLGVFDGFIPEHPPV